MKTSMIAAAAVIAAALVPTAGIAGPADVHAAVLFWAFDKNADGAVDRPEADTIRGVIFDAIDTNHDGRLTREEAGAALVAAKPDLKEKAAAKVAKKRETLVTRLDLAKPEGVARDEFVGRNTVLFVAADTDKNGKLSPVEFIVLAKSYAPLMPR